MVKSSKDIFTVADFYQWFEHIQHLFKDENGKIGRFIILRQCLENNIDLIAIDDKYNKEYRDALYIAQRTNNADLLVDIFKKCQIRLDEKLKDYEAIINQVKEEA